MLGKISVESCTVRDNGITVAGPRGPLSIGLKAWSSRSGESGDGGRYAYGTAHTLVELVWNHRAGIRQIPLRYEVEIGGQPLTVELLQKLIKAFRDQAEP